ncbi:MAG: RICIN domain-containing protein [Lachnospiraceae bacterium]|nr:RICIN domain-containing protein [Lachnospiraceae bacterium]
MKKRIVAVLMVIIMSAGFMPLFVTSEKVQAATNYNRDKALEYAAAHWNDGKGLCAEYVSNCIKAGGISSSVAWSKGCTTLITQLKKSGLGSAHEISLKSDMSIKASDYEGILSSGDIIFYYCDGCVYRDGKPYIHAVLYAGTDSNGYARCYSHNNANNASKRYYYSKKCYDCGTAIKKAYVFHFNTEDSQPEKPKRQYVRTIQDGWYWIETACDPSGNSVLNICGNSMENGGNLIIYPFEKTGNELFYVKYEGDGCYSIMSYSSGKYIHIADNHSVNENTHQWQGLHKNSMWFIYETGDGYYYLENKNNSGFLDLSNADTTPTNNVWTYEFNASKAQKWKLVPYEKKGQETTANIRQLIADGWYWIATACDSRGNSVLNICGNSMENGGNLIIYPFERTGNELFYVKYEGNGYYSMMSYSSGKYIHIADNHSVNENTHQWQGLHDNSMWFIYEAGDGYYYLENKNNSGFLDLSNADTTPTNNVWTYEYNASKAQKWKFIPYN